MDLRRQHQRADAANETRGKVLLVHPSAESRSRVRKALIDANCDVVEATDGTQAFMMVLASQIDLVVTELDMQPGSGSEFIAALSILPVDCMRPEVIVWSGLVGTPAGHAALEHLRVAATIERSAGLDRLLAAVDAVLDNPRQFVLDA